MSAISSAKSSRTTAPRIADVRRELLEQRHRQLRLGTPVRVSDSRRLPNVGWRSQGVAIPRRGFFDRPSASGCSSVPLVTFTAHFVQQPMRHAENGRLGLLRLEQHVPAPQRDVQCWTSRSRGQELQRRGLVSIASEGKPFHATFSMFVSESNAARSASGRRVELVLQEQIQSSASDETSPATSWTSRSGWSSDSRRHRDNDAGASAGRRRRRGRFRRGAG